MRIHLDKVLIAGADGKSPANRPKFDDFDQGMMAIIGRNQAYLFGNPETGIIDNPPVAALAPPPAGVFSFSPWSPVFPGTPS